MTGFKGKNVFFSEKSLNSDPLKMAARKPNYDTQFGSTFSTTFGSIIGLSFGTPTGPTKFEKPGGLSSLPALYKKNVRNLDFGFKAINSRTAFARKIYFAVLIQLGVIAFLQHLPFLLCPSLEYG